MFNLETVRMRNGYREMPGTIREYSFGALIYGDVKVERAVRASGGRVIRLLAD